MAKRSTLCLLFLAAALCLASAANSKEVRDVQTNSKGHKFIVDNDGQQWVVLGEEGSRFFLNEKTKRMTYTDPRDDPPAKAPTKVEEVEGAVKAENGAYYITFEGNKWSVHHDPETDRLFYHQAETKQTSWDDPRLPVVKFDDPVIVNNNQLPKAPAPPKNKPLSAGEKLRIGTVAMFPVVLFLGGLAARIYYLHTHYPELLFPTKERKERRRTAGGKFKPQKARGKMSQDGKGGRSANS